MVWQTAHPINDWPKSLTVLIARVDALQHDRVLHLVVLPPAVAGPALDTEAVHKDRRHLGLDWRREDWRQLPCVKHLHPDM